MFRIKLSIIIILVMFSIPSLSYSRRLEITQVKGRDCVKGELIVKFNNSETKSNKINVQNLKMSLLDRYKAKITKNWKIKAELWETELENLEAIIDSLNNNPSIEYAEPNYIIKANVVPNDPYFNDLWGLHNTGQSGGSEDADIDAPEAWDITTGSSDILVGVIDSGIDYLHPDLAENIWTNPNEIPGNEIDDDENGYIDDIHGWDFYNNDNDPMDDFGHGTHVSGTIGAVGNNGIGVAGVAWDVNMIALKFLGADGYGPTDGAVSAIEYSLDNGIRLTNNSWGSMEYSEVLYDVISSADDEGMLFIAAAGNFSSDNDRNPHYPASYDLLNIISVASTDRMDDLSSFSNFGSESVDIAAPGTSINSTLPDNNYGFKNGTSMAAPHVSGTAVLVWSVFPSFTHREIRQQILGNIDSVTNLIGIVKTSGRLNAYNSSSNDIVTPVVTISGEAFLDNQSEHGGIKVKFERITPSPLIDSTYTNSLGDYTILIETGIYKITFSNDNYFTQYLTEEDIYNNKTLQDVTLYDRNTIINVPLVYSSIQQAIDEAYNGDTVLVAEGTYFENINFIGKPITVASNFIFTQDTNTISNTIIDGDRLGHVVSFISREDTNSIFIGITLQNGYANGPEYPHNRGGGLLCKSSSPKLIDLIINDCESKTDGGGICLLESSKPRIANLKISNCSAMWQGGGILICNSSTKLNNVTISNNTAIYGGGGIGLQNSSDLTIENSTISNNFEDSYEGHGGGFYINSSSKAKIISCQIYSNHSTDQGGGLGCNWNSEMILKNSKIYNNWSDKSGGGISLTNNSKVSIINCELYSNSSSVHGGSIFTSNSELNCENNVITQNNSTSFGSGIYSSSSRANIKNSIISSNSGNYGIYSNLSNPTITYSCINNNEKGNFYNCDPLVGVNVNINVNGDSIDVYNNMQLNPLFEDTLTHNFLLQGNSPCINSGNPNVFFTDLDATRNDMGFYGGNGLNTSHDSLNYDFVLVNTSKSMEMKIFNYRNTSITLDSYELLSSQFNIIEDFPLNINAYKDTTISIVFSPIAENSYHTNLKIYSSDLIGSDYAHFPLQGTGVLVNYSGNTILVPADAPTIQIAINESSNGDTVLVSPGIYKENINFAGKKILLTSNYHLTLDTSFISQTIIDGDFKYRVVEFNNNEDNNSILCGFSIQNGSALNSSGGGVFCDSANPIIEYCTIKNNSAYYYGGGIACFESNPIIKNVSAINNSATYQYDSRGGGMYFDHSNPIIESAYIYSNYAILGGGINFDYSSATIDSTIFDSNEARYGGGLYINFCDSGMVIRNSTILKNTTWSPGGGINCSNYSSPLIENVTIKENYAAAGGAMCADNSSNPHLLNCLIFSNKAMDDTEYSFPTGGAFDFFQDCVPIIQNCVIYSNEALYDGGAITCDINSSPLIVNSNIFNNKAGRWGAGIMCYGNSTPEIRNTIVSDNIGEYGIYVYSGNPIVENSCLYNHQYGNFYNCDPQMGIETSINSKGDSIDVFNNIQLNPNFINATENDFHLASNSPCIDSGTPDTSGLNIPGTDLDGNERIWNGRIDMGAYEFGSGPPSAIKYEKVDIPIAYSLSQNYPNPFNPSTTLKFGLPKASKVKFEIYNILGQKIQTLINMHMEVGYHTISFDGKNLASGMYFYVIEADKFNKVKKMLLIK